MRKTQSMASFFGTLLEDGFTMSENVSDCFYSNYFGLASLSEMRIRYTSFNVDALKRIATTAAGADRCVQMVKMAEGNDQQCRL